MVSQVASATVFKRKTFGNVNFPTQASKIQRPRIGAFNFGNMELSNRPGSCCGACIFCVMVVLSGYDKFDYID